jgi:hypothetical protein
MSERTMRNSAKGLQSPSIIELYAFDPQARPIKHIPLRKLRGVRKAAIATTAFHGAAPAAPCFADATHTLTSPNAGLRTS